MPSTLACLGDGVRCVASASRSSCAWRTRLPKRDAVIQASSKSACNFRSFSGQVRNAFALPCFLGFAGLAFRFQDVGIHSQGGRSQFLDAGWLGGPACAPVERRAGLGCVCLPVMMLRLAGPAVFSCLFYTRFWRLRPELRNRIGRSPRLAVSPEAST